MILPQHQESIKLFKIHILQDTEAISRDSSNVETLCHNGQFRRNIPEERGFDFTVINKDLFFQILFHSLATLLPWAVGQDSPNESLHKKKKREGGGMPS